MNAKVKKLWLKALRSGQLRRQLMGLTMTTETITHDSITCTLGFMGQPCLMCQWSTELERQLRVAQDVATVVGDNNFEQQLAATIEQSTAAIHARRRALLQVRHLPDGLTDGAMALAEAHLQDEQWWQELPDNVAQDAEIFNLAGGVELCIASYLTMRRNDHQREQRRLREDG
jgi:hypothetical protein